MHPSNFVLICAVANVHNNMIVVPFVALKPDQIIISHMVHYHIQS